MKCRGSGRVPISGSDIDPLNAMSRCPQCGGWFGVRIEGSKIILKRHATENQAHAYE